MLVYEFVNGGPFWKSVGFVLVLLAVVMMIGALTGLRSLLILASILTLATAGMWIGLATHHYNRPRLPNSHFLNPASLPWSDFRVGAWLTIGGAVLGLLSAFALRRSVNS